MSDHIGESAALYALGVLEPHEVVEVDEHLERCDACRRLLAQAEADVTAATAAQEQFEPPAALRERITRSIEAGPQAARPRRNSVWLAAAAAVAIALLPAGYLLHQNMSMQQAMADDAQAMVRVAASPHRTVAFTGSDAHVMYAPDGSWYCIIVRDASAPVHVVWPHDGTMTALGTAVPHGRMALLYLPKSHRMDQLALMLDGRVVGQAQLVF